LLADKSLKTAERADRKLENRFVLVEFVLVELPETEVEAKVEDA
jgi:hypothetical protein